MARRADARGAVDVDADVALLADDRLAGVEAHADAKLLPSGQACAASARCAATAAATASRARSKQKKNASPCVSISWPPRRERVADDPPVLGEGVGVAVAELLEQLGRALDVGEHEGDRAAVQRASRAQPLVVLGLARRRRTRGFASLTISSR